MGEKGALLLVTRAAALLALLLASCAPQSSRVDPANYDAFFVWGGSRPPQHARMLYLLAGEVRRAGPPRLIPLRAVPRLPTTAVWLIVRTERLDWDEATWRDVLRKLEEWRGAGNRLAGLQIDFDAATARLGDYAAFLRGARTRLPAGCRLSVTGLMDWAANADPAALASLRGTIDEVVVQTYQGRATIPGYPRYFARLTRLPIAHRIALVEGGEWRAPSELAHDPRFTGYVVFLVPSRPAGEEPR